MATSSNYLFSLGSIVMTPGAAELFRQLGDEYNPAALLARHVSGDWGDMIDYDKRINDRAVKEGNRIFSAYALGADFDRFWVITEADRSSTTILLPEEY